MASTQVPADAAITRMPETGLGGRRKRRPQRYDEILIAAVELFHRQGYHQSSLEEIATAVGVTPTAIYRHFRNKQEILDTAALWMQQQLLERVQGVSITGTPTQRLTTLLENLVDTMLALPSFVGVISAELDAVSPETRDACMTTRDDYIVPWLAALRELYPDEPALCVEFKLFMVIEMVCGATKFTPPSSFPMRESLLSVCRAALDI